MINLLLVAAGGAIGAALRHLVNLVACGLSARAFPGARWRSTSPARLPWACSSATLARRFGASNELRLFVATGILGGFTTFSAFSLDFAVLWERGAALPALAYALASVVGSILALFLGLWLARSLG